ncbi:hypothetical protein Q5752_004186 [Cryptotrichosporon argae]
MATVIDDAATSLIYYSGTSWCVLGAGVYDPDTSDYHNATFHTSVNDGEYAVIAWYGTDIAIYGARRPNHGIYGIVVDGGAASYYSGYNANATFQQVLYESSGLAEADHTLTLANANSKNTAAYPTDVWVDLDFVAVSGTLKDAASAATSSSSTAVAAVTTTSATSSAAAATTSTSATSSTTSTTPSSSSYWPPSATPTSTFTSASTSASAAQPSSAPISSASSSTYTSSAASSAAASTTLALMAPDAQYSATSDTLATTGEPTTATNTGAGAGATQAADLTSTSSTHTTTVAVSVAVIVISAAVVATVAGLWWWRRRQRAVGSPGVYAGADSAASEKVGSGWAFWRRPRYAEVAGDSHWHDF